MLLSTVGGDGEGMVANLERKIQRQKYMHHILENFCLRHPLGPAVFDGTFPSLTKLPPGLREGLLLLLASPFRRGI